MNNGVDMSNSINNNTHEEPEQKDYIFDIIVSANRMQAFLRVVFCEKDVKIDPKEVIDKIKEQGIVYV